MVLMFNGEFLNFDVRPLVTGGEVYSCSKCPYVFCRKCILQNLSKNAIAEVERNVEWRCFSCAPSAISHLRAQHRALTNHLRQAKA